jgi:hypothetical protein
VPGARDQTLGLARHPPDRSLSGELMEQVNKAGGIGEIGKEGGVHDAQRGIGGRPAHKGRKRLDGVARQERRRVRPRYRDGSLE